ncbi:MAG: phage baseplate assembly protein V, partial [Oscillospiraceae bacterium]
VAMPMSGKNWGYYFLPEVGDQVLVAFEYGSVENPYVIGCIPRGDSQLISKNYNNDNDNKVIVTKGGNSIDIRDKDGNESITLTTKAEHSFTLDDGEDKITLKDKSGDNHIEIDTRGGNVEIQVKNKITLKAGKTTIEINGSSDTVTIKCQQLNAETKRGIKFKTSAFNVSSSSFSASATGTATIKSNSVLSVKGQSVILG